MFVEVPIFFFGVLARLKALLRLETEKPLWPTAAFLRRLDRFSALRVLISVLFKVVGTKVVEILLWGKLFLFARTDQSLLAGSATRRAQ